MTSKQVMLILAALWLGGCSPGTISGADPLASPYAHKRVWAIAPLRNESGSLEPDGAALADQLAHHLEGASNLDVLPVNRVLAAMEAVGLPELSSPAQALKVLELLGADALVVGTVTAYDPYDPPKLGMALELYASPRSGGEPAPDLRGLSSAAMERGALRTPRQTRQPVSLVSAVMDAADPQVRRKIQRYAADRGASRRPGDRTGESRYPAADADESWRFYRISMDLYGDFVCYVMSWRLLEAERERLVNETSPPPLR